MLQGNYKRSQVEWAIGQVTGARQGGGDEPKHELRVRIKRLLDVDRQHTVDPEDSQPEFKRYAFFEGSLPGRGTEIAFTSFDAFALLIATALLEAGITQSRIIRFMRTARRELAAEHKRILQTRTANDPKAGRTRTDRDGGDDPIAARAQAMVSLVLPAIGDAFYKRSAKGASLQIANICRSPEEMAEVVYLATRHGRPAVVFDLKSNAIELQRQLKAAPAIKRGRPSA